MILDALKKTLFGCKAGKWLKELPHVLWRLRTQPCKSTGHTLYFLVYGSKAVLPADVMWQSPTVEQYDEEEADESSEPRSTCRVERADEGRYNVIGVVHGNGADNTDPTAVAEDEGPSRSHAAVRVGLIGQPTPTRPAAPIFGRRFPARGPPAARSHALPSPLFMGASVSLSLAAKSTPFGPNPASPRRSSWAPPFRDAMGVRMWQRDGREDAVRECCGCCCS